MRLGRYFFGRPDGEAKRALHPDPAQPHSYRLGGCEVQVGRFTYGHETLEVRRWGASAGLRIGAFCSLAGDIEILLGGNHRVDWITTFPFGHAHAEAVGVSGIVGHPATRGDVVIGNDVWIGRGATLLSGVTIGDGAVIGAKSVVVRDVAPYEVWAGNPAERIRPRFAPEVIAALVELRWWDLPLQAIREIAPLLSQAPSLDLVAELTARYRG